jgi:hypothetical protein
MGICTVSRPPNRDIVIPGRIIRRNAAFHYRGFLTTVTDLGSLTRTYGNRRVVDRAVHADKIWIGKLRLILDWVSPARPRSPASTRNQPW